MARQKEIRVGSIVYSAAAARSWTGIVLAYPSRLEQRGEPPQGRTGIVLDPTRRSTFSRTADIYWLKERRRGWAYIYYLDVLVY